MFSNCKSLFLKGRSLFVGLGLLSQFITAQGYPPAAGEPGSTAIAADSDLFVNWASQVEVERGYLNIADPNFQLNGTNKVSYGNPLDAVGPPNNHVVSLGDGGVATITFPVPIVDGPGFDFAVFENSFNDTYLELAFVEVSSNGQDFFRFPAHSLTQTEEQIPGFGNLDPTHLDNLAGKYRSMFGTPFDLSSLPPHPLLDKQNITHIKLIDVVGSIDTRFGSFDKEGNSINDPFPTPFESGGFDLDAVGVINQKSLSISDLHGLSALSIYPNPATSFIQIKGTTESFTFYIYTAEGKIVAKGEQLPTEKIAIPPVNPGIYFVKIKSSSTSKLFRIIII